MESPKASVSRSSAMEAYVGQLERLKRLQLRGVTMALGLPRGSRADETTAIRDILLGDDPERASYAAKMVQAGARGTKRPGIVKTLLPDFDAVADF